jgi:thiamine biosynthesis lipoprotein
VAPKASGLAGSPAQELATARWEALGTGVVLRVGEPAALARARAAVEHELESIDDACSRFRADSELSRVNASDGRAVAVGPVLAQALAVALRAAELTDGDVDPTIGRALVLAGYDRDWRALPGAGNAPLDGVSQQQAGRLPERVLARVQGDWRAVAFDRSRRLVRVPRGVQLDLGATAKAWVADRAAAAATQAAGASALVAVGGDVATAGTPPPGGWRIHVTDDHRSDCSAPGQTVSVAGGGLATSSTAVRRWQHAGRTMHHVIDPRTGTPVRGSWRTVSVAAASCTDANIAATAALVRGARALPWLSELGLPCRLVDCSGNVTTLAGWPAA